MFCSIVIVVVIIDVVLNGADVIVAVASVMYSRGYCFQWCCSGSCCVCSSYWLCAFFATNVKTVVIDTTIAVDNDDTTNTVVIVRWDAHIIAIVIHDFGPGAAVVDADPDVFGGAAFKVINVGVVFKAAYPVITNDVSLDSSSNGAFYIILMG